MAKFRRLKHFAGYGGPIDAIETESGKVLGGPFRKQVYVVEATSNGDIYCALNKLSSESATTPLIGDHDRPQQAFLPINLQPRRTNDGTAFDGNDQVWTHLVDAFSREA